MKRRLFAIALLVLAILSLVAGTALAADTKQVGVIVSFPDGALHAEVVTIPANGTAFDALHATKVNLVSTTAQFGPAVCSINNTGCPASNCFCDAKHFWAFYQLDAAANKWVASSQGVGAVTPADGSVIGFVWTAADANFNPVDQPTLLSFSQIQVSPAILATPAATATAAPAAAQAAKPVAAPTALPTTGAQFAYLVFLAAGVVLLAAGGLLLRQPGNRNS